jgi:hypothetical protein
MSRGLRRAVIVGLVVVMAGGLVRLALPEVVRRVAIEQISRRTGRAVAIEDVDLGVLARRLSLKNVRLTEREGPEAFVALARLDARMAVTALARAEVRLTEVALVAPSIRLVRTGPGRFNVSDLVPRPAGPVVDPWTVTVDHLTITDGAVRARDEALTPPVEWDVRNVQAEAGPLTTRPAAPPGRGALQARLDEAVVDVAADAFRLVPLGAVVRLTLDGFELRRLAPYGAQAPYRLKGGKVGMALTATLDHEGEELTRAVASGTVTVEGEAVGWTERDEPFLDIARLDMRVKEANALTRSLTIEHAAVQGAVLQARRDARGGVDLVDVFMADGPARARAAAPAPSVPLRLFPVLHALGEGLLHVGVDRVTLSPSSVVWKDEAVTPTTTLALADLQGTLTDFTWPAKAPVALAFTGGLPGAGTLEVTGSVMPHPFDANLTVRLRGAPIHPYQAYIPGPGRLGGRFSGDSRHHVTLKDGALRSASTGRGWAEGAEVRLPGASQPALRVERMELAGIDVEWPTRASVARASFLRPYLQVVREADRSFDVVTLFTAPRAAGDRATAGAQPSALPRTARRKGLLETMRIDVAAIRVEDGFVRFLDRTTQPAFSKDLSRLTVAVDDLGNRPDERARIAVHSVVGGDSTLDLRGEVSAIGSPVFVDLVGTLDGMALASLNPYAQAATGWVVTQGDLRHKIHFVLDGGALAASNDLVLGQLRVAPASATDEVARRIGLPLDFVVALAKDGRGEIHVSVPVTGSFREPGFNFREAVWASVRQAVTNLVRRPLRSIGRLVQREDGSEVPEVDPVTFAAGSAVLAPDMEQHLLRVADVLRRSPFVNLTLTPAAGLADVEALQAQALTDEPNAPQETPGVVDLAERLDDLARRRVDATRERLVGVEGIPAERLTIDASSPDAASPSTETAGSVRLTVVASDR